MFRQCNDVAASVDPLWEPDRCGDPAGATHRRPRRLALDHPRRGRGGVPAAAPGPDPADPGRRGRLPPGRPGVGLQRRPASTARTSSTARRCSSRCTAGPTTSAARCSSGSSARWPARCSWSRPRTWPGWSPPRRRPGGPRWPSRRSPRNIAINAVAVKGELLALPFLMGSLWLALLAVRDRSWTLALGGGLLAGLALGFKQNLVGGIVFTAVLFVGSLARRPDLAARDLVRLAWRPTAGFARPGARHGPVGRRRRASSCATSGTPSTGSASTPPGVLAAGGAESETVRAGLLVVSALGAGMLLVIGGFVVHIRGEWEDDAPLTAAVAALLLVDVAGLVLGGSFWRDYLFPLLPGTALCAALLARRAQQARRGDALGDRGGGRLDGAAARRLGRLPGASGCRSSTRSTPARPSPRSPSPATPSSSSAGAPTCSSRAACRRRTSTSGPCRCAPWTRSSPTSRRSSPGRTHRPGSSSGCAFDTWSEEYGSELAALVERPLRAARARLRHRRRRPADRLAAPGHRPSRALTRLPRRLDVSIARPARVEMGELVAIRPNSSHFAHLDAASPPQDRLIAGSPLTSPLPDRVQVPPRGEPPL